MASSTKATWLANAKRMGLEADALEKKTSVGVKMDELKHEIIDMVRARNEAKLETIKRVHGIRLVLSDIQNKIKTNSWQSSNALKSQLETFESKLSAFKMVMRAQYDSLDESAVALEGEILRITDDMDSWDNIVDDTDASTAPDPEAHKRIQERNKLDLERRAAIGAIERKISALGRDGGWDPRDHDSFVRVWLTVFDNADHFEEQIAKSALHSHRADGDTADEVDALAREVDRKLSAADGVPAGEELAIPKNKRSVVIKRLATSVPWKSIEEIDEHINWYLEYVRLTLIKKRAVAEWKAEQVSAKRQQQDEILAGEVLKGDEALDSSSAAADALERDRKAPPPGSSEKDRAAAKARIAQWRAAQARQAEEEKEAKARDAAEEARRQEEERRRKQLQLRDQLGKWKAEEALNKELVGVASAKLQQRPKSVDPAAMRRRQQKDLEAARTRSERVEAANLKKTSREKAIMEAAVNVGAVAERDPDRLLAGTKASERNRLTYEALDAAERRRSSVGAHGANIALSARDLQFAGRATPQWIKSARGGF